ncbi:MAG: hypothetical protein JWO74_2302 [Solirubrobacterales bacterium]|nr:hypothetical protein [Solirubrobacterales bacterium]
MRWIERVVPVVALAVAGVAVYIALNARDTATRERAETNRLTAQLAEQRARLGRFHPTLVVQQRADDPFNAPRVKAGAGMQNVTVTCDEGAVVVGGGFNGFDGATILGSVPDGVRSGGGWLVNAVNENGGRGRVAPTAVCAHGEGGLQVRSTAVGARATLGP